MLIVKYQCLKSMVVCTHMKVQWRNLLSIVAHLVISFLCLPKKLERELARTIKTSIQRRVTKESQGPAIGSQPRKRKGTQSEEAGSGLGGCYEKRRPRVWRRKRIGMVAPEHAMQMTQNQRWSVVNS